MIPESAIAMDAMSTARFSTFCVRRYVQTTDWPAKERGSTRGGSGLSAWSQCRAPIRLQVWQDVHLRPCRVGQTRLGWPAPHWRQAACFPVLRQRLCPLQQETKWATVAAPRPGQEEGARPHRKVALLLPVEASRRANSAAPRPGQEEGAIPHRIVAFVLLVQARERAGDLGSAAPRPG